MLLDRPISLTLSALTRECTRIFYRRMLIPENLGSHSPGFIFTTSLPPAVVAGARASIQYQKDYMGDRRLQQLNSISLKEDLTARGIPVIPNPSHICPILVGDAEKAKAASDLLLNKHRIYVQSINFPTVPRGEERLRITPTPGHTIQQQATLIEAIEDVWAELGLSKTPEWEAVGGRAGVGMPGALPVKQLWTPTQLGLMNNSAPARLGDASVWEGFPSLADAQRAQASL